MEQLEKVRDQKKAELKQLKEEAALESARLDRELAELQEQKSELAEDEEQARLELRTAMKAKGWVFLGRPAHSDLYYQKASVRRADGVLSFRMLSTSAESWRWTEVMAKPEEKLWKTGQEWEPLPEGLELPPR